MIGVAVLVVMNALPLQPAARQAQPDDALIVDASGRVGIGKAPDSYALLDVSGMIKSQELNSGNDALVVKGGNVNIKGIINLGDPNKKPGQASTDQLKITAGYSGFSDFNNNAEISNDMSIGCGKALMLNGNSSRGKPIKDSRRPQWVQERPPRWVQVWDNLEVVQDLFVGARKNRKPGSQWECHDPRGPDCERNNQRECERNNQRECGRNNQRGAAAVHF